MSEFSICSMTLHRNDNSFQMLIIQSFTSPLQEEAVQNPVLIPFRSVSVPSSEKYSDVLLLFYYSVHETPIKRYSTHVKYEVNVNTLYFIVLLAQFIIIKKKSL